MAEKDLEGGRVGDLLGICQESFSIQRIKRVAGAGRSAVRREHHVLDQRTDQVRSWTARGRSLRQSGSLCLRSGSIPHRRPCYRRSGHCHPGLPGGHGSRRYRDGWPEKPSALHRCTDPGPCAHPGAGVAESVPSQARPGINPTPARRARRPNARLASVSSMISSSPRLA